MDSVEGCGRRNFSSFPPEPKTTSASIRCARVLRARLLLRGGVDEDGARRGHGGKGGGQRGRSGPRWKTTGGRSCARSGARVRLGLGFRHGGVESAGSLTASTSNSAR